MIPSLKLAWLQISHGRVKMLVATVGVVVAVLLMLMQLGFLRAALDSSLVVPRRIEADLIVLSPKSAAMSRTSPLARRLLYRLPAHPGVQAIQGVYLGTARWRNPWTHGEQSIFVYGLEPIEPMVRLDGVVLASSRLRLADTVLFDEASRPQFGPVGEAYRRGESIEAEVNRRRVKVVGLTRAGVTIGVDGNLVTSDANFLRIFPERSAGAIDLGLIRLRPEAAPERVRDDLARVLGAEAKVLTREEFCQQELRYMRENGPIEFIFTMGTAVGFFIGFVIVYQILHTDVANHLPQYATLKAIGFSHGYLLRVVLQEALLLAVLGFVPGLLLAWGLYLVTARATLLPLEMTTARAAGVFALTIVMCGVSGALAVRKLRAADPADVF
jgi:putative ABC transport system permease protein